MLLFSNSETVCSKKKGGLLVQKTYVLDTNILIQAPYALESFEENHIVLSLAVLDVARM